MDENQLPEEDVNLEVEGSDIEIEIVDDAPEEDRGREPVNVEDPSEDEDQQLQFKCSNTHSRINPCPP